MSPLVVLALGGLALAFAAGKKKGGQYLFLPGTEPGSCREAVEFESEEYASRLIKAATRVSEQIGPATTVLPPPPGDIHTTLAYAEAASSEVLWEVGKPCLVFLGVPARDELPRNVFGIRLLPWLNEHGNDLLYELYESLYWTILQELGGQGYEVPAAMGVHAPLMRAAALEVI